MLSAFSLYRPPSRHETPVLSATLPDPATQGFGSIPMRSLTADRIRCLQPRYRSVV
jgi:hypothetical protein